jgi:hypothetical protein
MIAAIERKHNVVWGLGPDKASAVNDAKNTMKEKSFNPGIKPNELELVPMAEDAPLGSDGFELFKHCMVGDIATNYEPAQIGLF